MAILKIYNDIQTENGKNIASFWGECEGICYKDVDAFCASIPDDDNIIDIRLHCDGGSVTEGWAIYDRLRATGKEITATVEGNAASMATVILMAAPKERRRAYESAHLCVHNPWMPAWGLGDAVTADDLQKAANDLRAEQERILNLYVERCECDREEMQNLMNEDKYIDVARALELGLIGERIAPISASKKAAISAGIPNNNHNNNKSKDMNNEEKKVEVKESFINKLLRFFGKSSIADIVFGMTLNTADGQELTIEREEGEPVVGDAASPDGEFLMPDGSTIIVKDGVIAEIKPAPTEGEGGSEGEGDDKKGEKDEGGTNEGEGGGDTSAPDEKDARIAELEKKVADLETENAELKEKLKDAEKNARSAEDMRLLNLLAMAGGEKALAKITSEEKAPQRENKKEAAPAGAVSAADIIARVKAHRAKK